MVSGFRMCVMCRVSPHLINEELRHYESGQAKGEVQVQMVEGSAIVKVGRRSGIMGVWGSFGNPKP